MSEFPLTQADKPNFKHLKKYKDGTERILNTQDNLKILFDFLGLKIRFNLMTYEIVLTKLGEVIESSDEMQSELISYISIYDVPKAIIEDHLLALANKNTFHPVKEWLEQSEWDQKPRLHSFLNCIPTKDDELTKIVLTKWFVGCVASLYEGNFHSKLVPILKSNQTYKKSALIQRFASVTAHSFLEGAELNPDNKDSVLACIYSWITEMGEMERTTKNSQGALKAFLTKGIDTVRPPFAKHAIKKKRQTNFIATVNESEFLKDQTGNSRYAVIELTAPVEIDVINEILGWKYDKSGTLIKSNPENLLQFWLEIKSYYLSGHSWILTPEERRIVDQNINNYLDKGDYYFLLNDYLVSTSQLRNLSHSWMTTTQICGFLNLNKDKVRNLGKALSKLSNEEVIKKKTLNGVSLYFWPK